VDLPQRALLLFDILVQSAPPIRCVIPPPGRIGGSFERQASLAAPFDLRTFRPDRESSHAPQIRKPHYKNRVTSTQRKTLTTHVSSTCSPALRTFLLCWLVPWSNVVSAGSHRYTNPVFEPPLTPHSHLLRTLPPHIAPPFWVAGLCRVQKEPPPKNTPDNLSKCKSFSHPRRPAPRLDASQRTKSATSPLGFHL
jgi:hypothetical protein